MNEGGRVMEAKESLIQEERIIHALNGFLMLFVSTVVLIAGTALFYRRTRFFTAWTGYPADFAVFS